MICLASVAAAAAPAPSPPAIVIDPAAAARGRAYDGIGGLSNSCAPWLRSYPEPQRSDILDALFLPRHAASVQVLKLEIGGDGHSTINTESSHRHTEGEAPSFERGWELWLAAEAKARNPAIRIGALAWSHPGWTDNDVNKTADYLVSWVVGVRDAKNLTIDFLGTQNEGAVPGGSFPVFATALRAKLDAAGLQRTLVDCCDSHDFGFVSDLADNSTAYFAAVGALAVHEPLRNAESVPRAALATGKPIWSSEAYTTYSDSNGAGCWARALSWGWVKGSVTSHIAWNLIQSYPSVGSGMNYNGHGLMWAEVPWAGHYVVNGPIWMTAHYTQATEVGWRYLPVGEGSGEFVDGGGTYVTLVDPADAGTFTIVLQAMEHGNSQCFKDTHPSFDVRNSTVRFQLAPATLAALGARSSSSSSSSSGGSSSSSNTTTTTTITTTTTTTTTVTLSARRSLLIPGDPIDPYHAFEARNEYFAPLPPIAVDAATGTFEIDLPVNAIVTVTSLPAGAGSRGRADAGLPAVPPSTPWPAEYCDSLRDYPVDRGMRYAMDQMGVWEAGASRDAALAAAGTTTMQQAVPADPVNWHNWDLQHPQTFVGPAMDVATRGTTLRAACSVLPGAAGWAGIGVGAQLPKRTSRPSGADLFPAASVLAVWANGSWAFEGKSGTFDAAAAAAGGGWVSVAINATGGGALHAIVQGTAVATAPKAAPGGSFVFLASSYAPVRAERAEFTDLCINGTAIVPPAPSTPTPAPPTPPTPPPPPTPPGSGLALAACDASDQRQQWTFSGEDGGEPGILSAASNTSACLDVHGGPKPPVALGVCAQPASQETLWTWTSLSGAFASVQQLPCLVHSHGKACSRCLDASEKSFGNGVDLFDCKPKESNQVWAFDAAAGAGLVRHKQIGLCLQNY